MKCLSEPVFDQPPVKKVDSKWLRLPNKPAQAEKGNEIWLLTLSDLLMLLMVFFVVLFAMAPKQQNHVEPTLSAEMTFPIIKQEKDQTEVQTVSASPPTSKNVTSSLETDLIAIFSTTRSTRSDGGESCGSSYIDLP